MKRRILIIMVALCSMMSCNDGVWDAIHGLEDKYNDLDGRLSKLEELCKEMNTNISALQTLVSVMLNNDYIVSIVPIMKENQEIGYTITFAIHDPITIYHGQNGQNGKDGKDGENGKDGQDGKDGKDGADGVTPIISVALDPSDNAYYWTLNGDWLLDAQGNRIPLTSKDGKDGKDGQDGKDAVTPQLKIENNYWYLSTDNGKTWTKLGKAVGENGKDGKDGTNGDSMFQSVTQDESRVYFTLSNGSVITINKTTSDFEQMIIDELVHSLTIDQTEILFDRVGQKETIHATTLPFSTSKKIWTSTDENVATVKDGVVTAVGNGSCRINVTAADKTQQCIVYVITIARAFSVSDTKQVIFSNGNLQYQASTNTWRFAEHQYDVIGTDNANISPTYTGWIDLFGWGTSGWNSGATAYQPFDSISTNSNYLANNLTSDYANADWGVYNAISNGGNRKNQWRTLTCDEWDYIFNQRIGYESLWGAAIIQSIYGLIILPDGWKGVDGITFYPQSNSNTSYHGYTLDNWNKLEIAGAIFLPIGGCRTGNTIKTNEGDYWASTCSGSNGCGVHFLRAATSLSREIVNKSRYRYYGQSVRLVQDIK